MGRVSNKSVKEGMDLTLDVENLEEPIQEVAVETFIPKTTTKVNKELPVDNSQKVLVNCLRNERVIVRHINKQSSITDPRHVNFGRMNENSVRIYSVPRLSSGAYVNVLTNDEKDFLEDLLGLEPNAMSIYKKEDNFWDDSKEGSLAVVTLKKQDNIFDLSNPEDYIRVKVLLANKNFIAESYQEYEDHPKATYEYYITSESLETSQALKTVNNKSQAYMKLGTIQDNVPKMRMLLELLTGRSTSVNSKSETLQVELSKCIESNAKEFLGILQDPFLDTKVLIKRCVEAGFISRRGDWYVLRSDNSPLCEAGQDPTLNMAAQYLNNAKHQDLLFSLQAKLNNK